MTAREPVVALMLQHRPQGRMMIVVPGAVSQRAKTSATGKYAACKQHECRKMRAAQKVEDVRRCVTTSIHERISCDGNK